VTGAISRFLVYALADPRSGDIRYIGRSSSGLIRPRAHTGKTALLEGNYKARWIRKILSIGLRPSIVVLNEYDTQDQLPDAEQAWIAFGRGCGWRLTNATDGGEGSVGLVTSDDAKRKLSEARKGKPLSAEHRAAIGRSMIGRRLGPESREKIRLSKVGKRRPPHVIEALRIANTGRHLSMDRRLSMGRTRAFCDNDGQIHTILSTAAEKYSLTKQAVLYCLRNPAIRKRRSDFRYVEAAP